MSKFIKKPVTVEAHRWNQNGDHPDDGNETFITSDGETARCEGKVVRYYRNPEVRGTDRCKYCECTMHSHGWIDTLEGGHIVCPGDWIITGVSGERYPCKPSIFSLTYDALD